MVTIGAALFGQEVVEMTAPGCGIFAGSELLRLRGIENTLYPVPHAPGCLGLQKPDWLQDGEDILGRNLVDALVIERRGIGGERRAPLRRVLGADAGRLRLDHGYSEGAERRDY